jgi:uncharacterized membrane protein
MVLDYVALGTIVFLMIGTTAMIVVTGSLPGDIARKRNHPWATAVSVAGWIGLLTAVFWPLALVWAFLPLPARPDGVATDIAESDDENAKLQQRIVALESRVAKLQSPAKDVDA